MTICTRPMRSFISRTSIGGLNRSVCSLRSWAGRFCTRILAGGSLLWSAGLSCNNGYFAVFLTRWLYDNLHVLPESRQKVHKTLNGEASGTVAHQCRDVRLLDAQYLTGFSLPDTACFDKAVDLQRELCF